MKKPQIGDLVWVKFPSDRDGKWIEVTVSRVEDRMFYGTPTGDPIVGWLGENIVLKGFENQVGTGGYDTWAFDRPVESDPAPTANDPAAELAALRARVAELEAAQDVLSRSIWALMNVPDTELIAFRVRMRAALLDTIKTALPD